jgi:outer membrane protein TolC
MASAKYLLLLLLLPGHAFALRALKPQDVVDAVLTKSLQAETITLDAQQDFVLMERALGVFDFGVKGNAGYEYREAETLTGLANPIDKTLTANLSLVKKTSVGAELEVGYLHQAQSSVLNSITAATRDPNLTLDSAYLQWRQHLWGNSFGLSDRAELNVARKRFKSSDLTKQESTEELVLSSLRLFWETYVAQTKLKDSITARQMYKNLIGVVQKRGRFGLDKGGEYAQVMADYMASDNAVKTASYEYLDKMKLLERQMQDRFAEDMDFQVPDLVPPLPRLSPVKAEDLRAMKLAQSELENAEALKRSVDWRNEPVLDLIARSASTGVDPRANAAYSELVAGTKPTYYLGLEFSLPLDSSAARANEAEARVAYGRQSVNFKTRKQDIESRLILLERRLEQTFTNANGALEIEKYRQRTVREQENEYRQGRLPLRDLLQTYEKFFDSQTQRVQAIGDYHITLNEMAALRDELVR